MPALSGRNGTAVVVNGTGTGLGNTVGTLALAGNFATTGAFNLTFSVAASVTLSCPATSDTLVGRATTDTLTNKTLTAPVMTAPVLGTPASGTLTNCTGLPNGGLLNSSVTIGSTNVALGATAATIAGLTLTSPILTTPALGTPSAGVLTSCTGLPISTGVSGLGTGVATLLSGTASGTGGPAGTASPTFTGTLSAATVSASASVSGTAFIPSGSSVPTNGMYLPSANTLAWALNSTLALTLDAGHLTLTDRSFLNTFNGATLNGIDLRDSADASGAWFVMCRNGAGTTIGGIQRNAATNAVQFQTTSDHRLKDDITPLADGIERVKALRPSAWNWKGANEPGEGFIAHELQVVVPQAVAGDKDATNGDGSPLYQCVDYSKVVPVLAGATKELIALVETLMARVAALEAR